MDEKRCFTYCGPERCDCDASGGIQEAIEEARRERQAMTETPARLEQACRIAADQFREYARQHRAKATPEADAKALVNDGMAIMCESAIAAWNARPTPEGASDVLDKASASIAHMVDEWTERGWNKDGRDNFASLVRRRLARFITPETAPVDAYMMPPLWALGHMPADWGPVPGVPATAWAWLLAHGYIERNEALQVRITAKGWDILKVRPPGKSALAVMAAPADVPVPMILHCPKCQMQHVDVATEDWPNPPHRSHLCLGCGYVWRPSDFPTTGVVTIQTQGKMDSPPVAPTDALTIAREALERIAAFNDSGAGLILKRTGSYGAFDEPGSVQAARAALAAMEPKT